MKFKKDADGKLVLDDHGNPILVDDEGKDVSLDDLSAAKGGDADDKKVVALGKFERVERERDEYKGQLSTLQGEVESLKASAGNADELKAKVDELTAKSAEQATEFEASMAARAKEHALDTTLLASGVRPNALKAAKAYIDLEAVKLDGDQLSGFDVEAFKKDQAFLFDTQASVSTGAPARGVIGGDTDEAQTRAAMGLKPKE